MEGHYSRSADGRSAGQLRSRGPGLPWASAGGAAGQPASVLAITPPARPELGQPGCGAEPDPEGCEPDVEDEHAEHEQDVPEQPAPERDPACARRTRARVEAGPRIRQVGHVAFRSFR